MSDELSVTSGPATASAEDGLESSKSHALQAAEELRAAASAKAQQLKQAAEVRATQFKDTASEKAHQFKDVAEESATQLQDLAGTSWDDAKVKAQDFHAESEEYIRANPTKAVLTALGVGFVLGLILRR